VVGSCTVVMSSISMVNAFGWLETGCRAECAAWVAVVEFGGVRVCRRPRVRFRVGCRRLAIADLVDIDGVLIPFRARSTATRHRSSDVTAVGGACCTSRDGDLPPGPADDDQRVHRQVRRSLSGATASAVGRLRCASIADRIGGLALRHDIRCRIAGYAAGHRDRLSSPPHGRCWPVHQPSTHGTASTRALQARRLDPWVRDSEQVLLVGADCGVWCRRRCPGRGDRRSGPPPHVRVGCQPLLRSWPCVPNPPHQTGSGPPQDEWPTSDSPKRLRSGSARTDWVQPRRRRPVPPAGREPGRRASRLQGRRWWCCLAWLSSC